MVGDGCTVNLDRLNGFNQPKAGGGGVVPHFKLKEGQGASSSQSLS